MEPGSDDEVYDAITDIEEEVEVEEELEEEEVAEEEEAKAEEEATRAEEEATRAEEEATRAATAGGESKMVFDGRVWRRRSTMTNDQLLQEDLYLTPDEEEPVLSSEDSWRPPESYSSSSEEEVDEEGMEGIEVLEEDTPSTGITRRSAPKLRKQSSVSVVFYFLAFLAGEGHILTRIGATTEAIKITKEKLSGVAASLKADVQRQAVEAAGQKPEGALAIEPWMAGAYLDSAEVELARQLLIQSIDRPLGPREMTTARNSLMLRIMLSNFKRSGDLTNLTRTAVREARADDEEGSEMFVITHKEASAGKRCPILVEPELLDYLRLYEAHVAKQNPGDLLFTTSSGGRVSCSNMAKVVDTTWSAFGRANQISGLPKLTCSLSRKLAVSTHREMETSREEQSALAAHMAHEVVTADKYYNKSARRASRQKARDAILGEYKSAHKRRRLDDESPAAVHTTHTTSTSRP